MAKLILAIILVMSIAVVSIKAKSLFPGLIFLSIVATHTLVMQY